MSVRKRTWKTTKGGEKTAWIVDYTDGQGVRRLKTFGLKKAADAFAAIATVQIQEGMHVADSASATVKVAGEMWVAGSKAVGLEQSTTDQYRQHLNIHIAPLLGEKRLSELTIPIIRAFEDELRAKGRSPAMLRKVIASLGSIVADAQERGLVARNVVRDMRGKRKTGNKRWQKSKLKAGVDIPNPQEVKAIVGALQGRWRPLLLTAIFTGLRASEVRGLPWNSIDLERGVLHVHQRADRFNKIGRPKSEAGERSVPVPPIVQNALKEWKLKCPKGELGLAFPNGSGNIESLGNIINRGLVPAQVAAGVTVDSGKTDKEGNPVASAKYTGMHSLRHFYASWCINGREQGGLGLPPKVVQERLGHSSIVMTMDVYGHLFPRGDDADELAQAEQRLLG